MTLLVIIVLPLTLTAQSRAILADQLKPYILQQTGGDDATIILDPQLSINTTTNIESVQVDPQRSQFTAYIQVGDKVTATTGKYNILLPIPVLIDPVNRGDVITESNVDYISVPEKSLNKRIIHSTEDLTGMAAKRSLRSGRPVRVTDVHPPRLVKKGERVVLTVNNPLMQLTAEGKALEHGGKNDVIRVLNVDSKQMVTGIVVAPNKVEVQ